MPPLLVKGVRSFLGHVDFYRRFIKYFSKISKPLCSLLEKNATFEFDEDCLKAFDELKKQLILAPIMATPNWDSSFKLMYDTSNNEIGTVTTK